MRSIGITSIIHGQHVLSVPPMISRTSPWVTPSCSQVWAVFHTASSNTCITPRKAEGEPPTGGSRPRRVKNSRSVSTSPPALAPTERVVTTRRVNPLRPSAVSQNQDSGGRCGGPSPAAGDGRSLGQPSLLGQVATARVRVRTKTLEHPKAFVR